MSDQQLPPPKRSWFYNVFLKPDEPKPKGYWVGFVVMVCAYGFFSYLRHGGS
jgi:hypothetical protein